MVTKASPKPPKGKSLVPPYEAFIGPFIERIFRPELYKVLGHMSDRKDIVTMTTLHEAFRKATETTASITMFRRWMRLAGVELEQTFRVVVPEDSPGGETPEPSAPRVPRGVAVTGTLVPGIGGLADTD